MRARLIRALDCFLFGTKRYLLKLMFRRRDKSWLLIVLIVAALSLFPSCDAFTGFEGHIRDTDGRPIEGAKIVLSRNGYTLAEEESHANGSYGILKSHWPFIFRNTVLLTVSKNGFKTYQKEFTASKNYNLDVVLEPDLSH